MPTLHWLTRDHDLSASARVPYRLLREEPALSYGDPATGNMLLQGDNLDALKALLRSSNSKKTTAEESFNLMLCTAKADAQYRV